MEYVFQRAVCPSCDEVAICATNEDITVCENCAESCLADLREDLTEDELAEAWPWNVLAQFKCRKDPKALCIDCGSPHTPEHECEPIWWSGVEAFDKPCPECERSYGPHYNGVCRH
jgi:hypothetical protein